MVGDESSKNLKQILLGFRSFLEEIADNVPMPMGEDEIISSVKKHLNNRGLHLGVEAIKAVMRAVYQSSMGAIGGLFDIERGTLHKGDGEISDSESGIITRGGASRYLHKNEPDQDKREVNDLQSLEDMITSLVSGGVEPYQTTVFERYPLLYLFPNQREEESYFLNLMASVASKLLNYDLSEPLASGMSLIGLYYGLSGDTPQKFIKNIKGLAKEKSAVGLIRGEKRPSYMMLSANGVLERGFLYRLIDQFKKDGVVDYAEQILLAAFLATNYEDHSLSELTDYLSLTLYEPDGRLYNLIAEINAEREYLQKAYEKLLCEDALSYTNTCLERIMEELDSESEPVAIRIKDKEGNTKEVSSDINHSRRATLFYHAIESLRHLRSDAELLRRIGLIEAEGSMPGGSLEESTELVIAHYRTWRGMDHGTIYGALEKEGVKIANSD